MQITKKLDADQAKIIKRGADDRSEALKALRPEERAIEEELAECERRYAKKKKKLAARQAAVKAKQDETFAKELDLAVFVLRGDGFKRDCLQTLRLDLGSSEPTATWDDGQKAPSPEDLAAKKRDERIAEDVGKSLAEKAKKRLSEKDLKVLEKDAAPAAETVGAGSENGASH